MSEPTLKERADKLRAEMDKNLNRPNYARELIDQIYRTINHADEHSPETVTEVWLCPGDCIKLLRQIAVDRGNFEEQCNRWHWFRLGHVQSLDDLDGLVEAWKGALVFGKTIRIGLAFEIRAGTTRSIDDIKGEEDKSALPTPPYITRSGAEQHQDGGR